MDMKEAAAELRKSKTLDWILAVVLTIVNFLNGSKVCTIALYDLFWVESPIVLG